MIEIIKSINLHLKSRDEQLTHQLILSEAVTPSAACYEYNLDNG